MRQSRECSSESTQPTKTENVISTENPLVRDVPRILQLPRPTPMSDGVIQGHHVVEVIGLFVFWNGLEVLIQATVRFAEG